MKRRRGVSIEDVRSAFEVANVTRCRGFRLQAEDQGTGAGHFRLKAEATCDMSQRAAWIEPNDLLNSYDGS
jgi:hypothetical protein